jgi:hypothetical protein
MRPAALLGAVATLVACGPPTPVGAPPCREVEGASACLVAARQRLDPTRRRLELLAGVFQRGPGLSPPTRIRVRVGERLLWPADIRGLRAAGESRGEDWTPPLATAIVYLWAKGTTPPGIRSGVSFLAQALPAGARVCPKSYGQHHYQVACLPAYHIADGSLLEDQHPGQFVHFLAATRQSLAELSGLGALLARDGDLPLRWMVIITDGRDAENGSEGEESHLPTRQAFAALGTQLRQAGVLTQVVSFPCAANAEACQQNVEALVQAAGAAHLQASDEQQVEEKIRQAALTWFEMKALAVALPWYQRFIPGSRPLTLEADLAGGTVSVALGSIDGTNALASWPAPLLLLSFAGLLLFSLRRGPFRRWTRGRGFIDPGPSRRLYAFIGEALTLGLTPRKTSRRLRALFSTPEWSALAAASGRQLARELESQATLLPALRSADARRFLEHTQLELRDDQRRPLATAWLVVASGAHRGQTIALPSPRSVLGRGEGLAGASLDPNLHPHHAEIVLHRGCHLLRPLEGPVSLHGQVVTGERELRDGDQLLLGSTRLVFKSVTGVAG